MRRKLIVALLGLVMLPGVLVADDDPCVTGIYFCDFHQLYAWFEEVVTGTNGKVYKVFVHSYREDQQTRKCRTRIQCDN